MFKKETFMMVWWFDKELRQWYEDRELWINYISHGFIWKYIDMIWFEIRVLKTSRSFTTAKENELNCINYIINKHENLYKKYNLKKKLVKYLYKLPDILRYVYLRFLMTL